MRDDEIIVTTLFFFLSLLLVPLFDIVDLWLFYLWFFSIWVFHVNLGVPSFSFLFYLPLFSNKLVLEPFTFSLLFFPNNGVYEVRYFVFGLQQQVYYMAGQDAS